MKVNNTISHKGQQYVPLQNFNLTEWSKAQVLQIKIIIKEKSLVYHWYWFL